LKSLMHNHKYICQSTTLISGTFQRKVPLTMSHQFKVRGTTWPTRDSSIWPSIEGLTLTLCRSITSL
jgi:hypothetical protein